MAVVTVSPASLLVPWAASLTRCWFLLQNELRLYDPSLIDRRCILLANKMDMVPKASKIMEQLRQATDLEVYQMSAKDPSTGIAEVAMALRRHVEESGDPPAAPSS